MSKSLEGTQLFYDTLSKKPRTGGDMIRALKATIKDRVENTTHNEQQEEFSKSDTVAIFLPGFQLSKAAYGSLIGAFNNKGIPVYIPPDLPTGIKAVLYPHHPDTLVQITEDYVRKFQKDHPDKKILLVGHSYGATQAAHVGKKLSKEKLQNKVTVVSIQGLLDNVGVMAHALPQAWWYRKLVSVFSGVDPFIEEAQDFMMESEDNIIVFDRRDGFLNKQQQSGGNNLRNKKIISVNSKDHSGHFQHAPEFAEEIVEGVLDRFNELMG